MKRCLRPLLQYYPKPESLISSWCYLGVSKVKILCFESVSPETGQRAKNPQTQLFPPPWNSRKFKIASPHFLIYPSNGLVSQRLPGWVSTSSYPLTSHLCSPALHCPTAPQALSFHLVCFQVSSPHSFNYPFSYASLFCLFFHSKLHSCIICMKYSSSEHILPTSRAFLRYAGEGARGFSHIQSYAIMITPLTLQNPTMEAGLNSESLPFIRSNHLGLDSTIFSYEKNYLIELFARLKLS